MTGVEEGALIAGVGVSVYGALSSASAKADAAKRDAALKNQQANELLSREQINEGLIEQQAFQSERGYESAQGATGVEGGVGGVLAIKKNTAITIANSRRDAEFKAKMLRAGADIANNLASDEVNASYVTGAGTILTGLAKGYGLYKGASSKTTSLPNVGETD